MIRLNIKTSKEYDVVIAEDFSVLKDELNKVIKGKKVLVVTDTNVMPLYGDVLKDALKDYECFFYVIEAGEKSKNAQNFILINEYLAERSFSRNDTVISLGGGVCGDLAGFVASSYMRGVNFIQCPTTLLADVDSSVGGKTAIDLKQGKNLVGAFYQPSLVYVSLSALKTLPKTEITNGMGEVVKCAFLSKTVTKEMIENRDFEKMIFTCLNVKADIVHEDEFENGKRMFLNLGHTVGHAIESLAEYNIPHGLCVAKGIEKIINASAKFYNLDDKKVKELKTLLNAYPFDLATEFSDEQIANKIKNDKKTRGDLVFAVLIKDVGDVCVEKIKISEFGDLISE